MAKRTWMEKVKRKPKFKVRGYYRCQRCGRSRGTPQVQAVPHLFP